MKMLHENLWNYKYLHIFVTLKKAKFISTDTNHFTDSIPFLQRMFWEEAARTMLPHLKRCTEDLVHCSSIIHSAVTGQDETSKLY